MSFSLPEKCSSGFSGSYEEKKITIYEHVNSCGGINGFYYIQNGGGICGNNYFHHLKDPCRDPIPPQDHPY